MSNRFLKSSEVLEYIYDSNYDSDLIRYIDDSTENPLQKKGFYNSVIKKFGFKFE